MRCVNIFSLFQLPEIVGTGHVYKISMIAIYSTTKDGQNSTGESLEVTEEFMTKPLAPTKLSIGNKDNPLEICWRKSVTPNVVSYKIRQGPLKIWTELFTQCYVMKFQLNKRMRAPFG
jgi:hypothetical protein